MPELRKGVDLRSIDVVRTFRGAGNTEAARCDEVAGPSGFDGPASCEARGESLRSVMPLPIVPGLEMRMLPLAVWDVKRPLEQLAGSHDNADTPPC